MLSTSLIWSIRVNGQIWRSLRYLLLHCNQYLIKHCKSESMLESMVIILNYYNYYNTNAKFPNWNWSCLSLIFLSLRIDKHIRWRTFDNFLINLLYLWDIDLIQFCMDKKLAFCIFWFIVKPKRSIKRTLPDTFSKQRKYIALEKLWISCEVNTYMTL